MLYILIFMQPQGFGSPSVYHAVIVIFLEFFAWGLLTAPTLVVSYEWDILVTEWQDAFTLLIVIKMFDANKIYSYTTSEMFLVIYFIIYAVFLLVIFIYTFSQVRRYGVPQDWVNYPTWPVLLTFHELDGCPHAVLFKSTEYLQEGRKLHSYVACQKAQVIGCPLLI